uniref:Transposase n=1 Tax=Heterorhabditis bacteriophora TaxID=37862 RepID=A0A1I7WPP6_HETBA
MAEHENPFRPEEILYHEVDPIVEQYLHKPFPPSRPGSAQNTPVKQQRGRYILRIFIKLRSNVKCIVNYEIGI